MSLRDSLATVFVVNETVDGDLLLRPRAGGRAAVLVMSEAAREHLAGLEASDEPAATVLRAIGSARGGERYVIAHGGGLAPSLAPDHLVRDTRESIPAPSGGEWRPYS